jgi:ABC-2 type transport system ATP-binding protein
MPAVVRTENLTKDFPTGFWRSRPHRALDGLSLDVPAGGVFGLLGPNGAGKSTTLKLLLNLLHPTSGRVELLGRPAGDSDARRRLGFLPEEPVFYDRLTAEQLLSYFAGLFGYARDDSRARVASVLDRVGIGADRRRPLRQYSKGMIQRVGLAQALLNDPELVILDEPMSGLDPLGRRDLRDIILELADEGRTILFSSHILADAEVLCSHVAILAAGRLVRAGTLVELTGGQSGAAEIVFSNLPPETAERARTRVERLRCIGGGRYSLTLGEGVRPEPVIAELAAAGGVLVSVATVRATLEDVFVDAIRAGSSAPPLSIEDLGSPASSVPRSAGREAP